MECFFFRWGFVAAFLFTATSAFAIDPKILKNKCEDHHIDGYDVTWCHEYVPKSTSTEVIYFFHGINDGAKTWHHSTMGQQIRAGMTTSPHIITVSFGIAWFLTDVSYWNPSRLEVFDQEIQPQIEKELSFKVTKRIVMGESMGGYNALRLASERPNDFDRVVVTCPAVMVYSPFWTYGQRRGFYSEYPYVSQWRLEPLKFFGYYEFTNETNWLRNSPLALAQTPNYKLPPILISTNSEDWYGFNVGASQFMQELQSHQLPFEFHEESGGHCKHTPELYQSIAHFLDQ